MGDATTDDRAEGRAPAPAAEAAPKPKSRMSNLASRLATAAVFVPLLLWLLYLAPGWSFLILVFVAIVVASAELFAMTMPGARLAQAWGVVASLGVASVVLFLQRADVLVGTMGALVVAGFLVSLVQPEPIERAAQRMGWAIAGPLYTGGLIATLALLHQQEHGGSWVVLAMMFAWLSDTGGYFAGRAFGKHKLYEKVSPKKTIEGAIGGLGGSVAGALLAHFWFLPVLPLLDGVILAVVAGAIGQAGDLCESLIKRSVGVKDSGSILPGHGGLLDRIDALVFTGAVTWAYVAWVL